MSGYTYIGRKKCGCVVAARVDADYRGGEAVAADVADFIKSGYTVERVTTEEARTLLHRCRCAENRDLFAPSRETP